MYPFIQFANRISATRNGLNVASRLTPNSMKSSIQRARSALYPNVPISLYDLGQLLNDGQHQRLTMTEDGLDNIFTGVVQHNEFTSLIFISRRMRRFMRRVKVVFCDGTFGSRPNAPTSSQVLQLSCVVRNHVSTHYWNCHIMSNPFLSYIIFHTAISGCTIRAGPNVQQKGGGICCGAWAPPAHGTWFSPFNCNDWLWSSYAECVGTSISNPSRWLLLALLQGEAQIMSIIYKVVLSYLTCIVMWQAVIRKARTMGFVPAMNAYPALKSLIRSVCGLPLLPRPLMMRGLMSLISEARRRGFLLFLQSFFLYIINTWMSPNMIRRLCVFRLKHRTNNVAECANRLLRNRTGAHRPGLWHFHCK